MVFFWRIIELCLWFFFARKRDSSRNLYSKLLPLRAYLWYPKTSFHRKLFMIMDYFWLEELAESFTPCFLLRKVGMEYSFFYFWRTINFFQKIISRNRVGESLNFFVGLGARRQNFSAKLTFSGETWKVGNLQLVHNFATLVQQRALAHSWLSCISDVQWFPTASEGLSDLAKKIWRPEICPKLEFLLRKSEFRTIFVFVVGLAPTVGHIHAYPSAKLFFQRRRNVADEVLNGLVFAENINFCRKSTRFQLNFSNAPVLFASITRLWDHRVPRNAWKLGESSFPYSLVRKLSGQLKLFWKKNRLLPHL